MMSWLHSPGVGDLHRDSQTSKHRGLHVPSTEKRGTGHHPFLLESHKMAGSWYDSRFAITQLHERNSVQA